MSCPSSERMNLKFNVSSINRILSIFLDLGDKGLLGNFLINLFFSVFFHYGLFSKITEHFISVLECFFDLIIIIFYLCRVVFLMIVSLIFSTKFVLECIRVYKIRSTLRPTNKAFRIYWLKRCNLFIFWNFFSARSVIFFLKRTFLNEFIVLVLRHKTLLRIVLLILINYWLLRDNTFCWLACTLWMRFLILWIWLDHGFSFRLTFCFWNFICRPTSSEAKATGSQKKARPTKY